MARPSRVSPIARLLLAATLAIVGLGSLAPAPDATAAALPRWTGGIDLYRSGVFTTQKTWLWCTAADVQIIRNIADRQADHSRASQQRYFDYMRAHNRYGIPVKDGVDPAGWTAGLRHFVDSRYRLYASGSFDSALRAAVTNLRLANLPVGITVSHGNHAWILTGFTATADPATTTRFTVTSVRVVGPLWGLQSRTFGYDMRPDRKLTPAQLKTFFTPWHYAGVKMAWEGRWVSVQPVAASPKVPKPVATPAPTVRPTATPMPSATLVPASQPSLAPAPSGEPDPTATAADIGALVVPASSVPRAVSQASPVPLAPAADTSGALLPGGFAVLLAALGAMGAAAIGVTALRNSRRR